MSNTETTPLTETSKAMTDDEAREMFDEYIQYAKEDGVDPERIAKLEVVREFFCDRQFARLMMDFIWELCDEME